MTSQKKSNREPITKASAAPMEETLAVLREHLPAIFSEGKIDEEKLRTVFGESLNDRPERYSFDWAGKRDAQRVLQLPSRATLEPMGEESVNFDETNHVFIDGENLEVLKLLYKSYFGRVKMIYIDPPYNTGKDFVYRDDFTDPLGHYLELTGQTDTEGNLLTSNPETSGRFHSTWLSMLYPRLFIARQLLREDGVIFVSIDDHEVANLRLLMNEVFGEESFVSQFVWQKAKGGGNSTVFYEGHKYVLIYRRSSDIRIPLTKVNSYYDDHLRKIQSGNTQNYRQIDDTWYYVNDDVIRKTFGKYEKGTERRMYYEDIERLKGAGKKKQVDGWLADGTHIVVDAPESGMHFVAELKPIDYRQLHYSLIQGVLSYKGKRDYQDVLGIHIRDGEEYPKPVELVRILVDSVCEDGDLVVDSFAGSGTTGQAVLEMNAASEDRQLRFLLVQLPEPLDPDSSPGRAGYASVTEVAKERLRRSASSVMPELQLDPVNGNHLPGFRVFILRPSNYRQWSGVAHQDPEAYAKQMEAFTDPLVDGWTPRGVLWEVALKEGFSLTSRVTERKHGINTFWHVLDEGDRGEFWMCLDVELGEDAVRSLNLTSSDLFICRDTALTDTMVANLALQCQLKTI